MFDRSSRSVLGLTKGIGSLVSLFPQAVCTEYPKSRLASKSAWDLYTESFGLVGKHYGGSIAELEARITEEQKDQLNHSIARILANSEASARRLRANAIKRSEEILRWIQEASKEHTLKTLEFKDLFPENHGQLQRKEGAGNDHTGD